MQKKRKDPSAKFIRQCREHRLRLTPQRVLIYEELKTARNHPSAEQIYRRVRERMHHISFDTVNRTLLKFAEIRLVDTVEGSGEPRRFDPDTSRHSHLVCSRCGAIVDITDPEGETVTVPEEIRRRFNITGRRIVYHGICEMCRGDHNPERGGEEG